LEWISFLSWACIGLDTRTTTSNSNTAIGLSPQTPQTQVLEIWTDIGTEVMRLWIKKCLKDTQQLRTFFSNMSEVDETSEVKNSPLHRLARFYLSGFATASCKSCTKKVEGDCYAVMESQGTQLWHTSCRICCKCHRSQRRPKSSDIWGTKLRCRFCGEPFPGGFVFVHKMLLSMLVDLGEKGDEQDVTS
jgi:hypothetical protein